MFALQSTNERRDQAIMTLLQIGFIVEPVDLHHWKIERYDLPTAECGKIYDDASLIQFVTTLHQLMAKPRW